MSQGVLIKLFLASLYRKVTGKFVFTYIMNNQQIHVRGKLKKSVYSFFLPPWLGYSEPVR